MAYALWLCLSPDYSSANVAMFATSGLAAVYAAATAICWLSAPSSEGWLGIGALKLASGNKPTMWCAVIVLLASLTAYFCGHLSHRWRKFYEQRVVGSK
jgi:hypothetical protein